jgi:hypothetical protein
MRSSRSHRTSSLRVSVRALELTLASCFTALILFLREHLKGSLFASNCLRLTAVTHLLFSVPLPVHPRHEWAHEFPPACF